MKEQEQKPKQKNKKEKEKKLSCLFDPQSVAVVGASHSGLKLGGVVLQNLLRSRRRIKIFPVNPNYSRLFGMKAYPSAGSIKERLDLAIIIRPAGEVQQVLEGLAGKASCAIVVSAGFAETGQTALQEAVLKTAREGGIRVLGPNCMGVYNAATGLDTFILPPERLARPPAGGVAVVTQSGAVLSMLFAGMAKAGLGVSIAAHYGNASDLDESDIFEYLENDAATEAAVCYLESVRDGRRFMERAKALSEKKQKPFIILKAGKAAAGQAAAFSHTGRLAGAYEVFHSILAQFRIREAQDFEDLMDGALALFTQVKVKIKIKNPKKGKTDAPGGKRVLVLTNGGGAGVLASDECARQGFEQPGIPAARLEALKKIFPPFCGIGNPFDLTAQGRDRDYPEVLGELGGSYDGFVIIALTAVAGITPALAGLLADFRKRTGKPMVLHTGQDRTAGELAREAGRNGIPAFATPERTVRALSKLLQW